MCACVYVSTTGTEREEPVSSVDFASFLGREKNNSSLSRDMDGPMWASCMYMLTVTPHDLYAIPQVSFFIFLLVISIYELGRTIWRSYMIVKGNI